MGNSLLDVSVQIKRETADSTEFGSGCVVKAGRLEVFYCLTASHCVSDGKITLYRYDEKSERYVEQRYSSIFRDEVHDAAILQLEGYPAETYPVEVYSGKRSDWDKQAQILGYPAANPVLTPIVVEINSLALSPDQTTVHMQHPYTEHGSLDTIRGISGGGCFVRKKTGYFKLIGIEKAFLDEEHSQAALVCTNIEVFQDILQKNGLPLLLLWEEYIDLNSPGVFPVWEKLEQPEFRNPWVDTNGSNAVQGVVHGYFAEGNKQGALLLYGSSGIGKTRTVLEACANTAPFHSALIFESYNAFQKFQEELARRHDETYLIVDDVTLKDWLKIVGFCNDHPFCRVVCISAELDKELSPWYDDSYNLWNLKVCADDDVKRLIRAYYNTLDDESVNAICELSDRDLRFALLFAELFRRNPDLLSRQWIMAALNTPTFAAEEIIKRRLGQVSPPLDVHHTPEDIAKVFSLFLNFDLQHELHFISHYFGITQDELEDWRKAFQTQRLGFIRDNYFELSPRALARILFTAHYKRMILRKCGDFGNFMDSMPGNEMRKSFLRRVLECGEKVKEEVGSALALWFQNKYRAYGLAEFVRQSQSGIIQNSSGNTARFSVDEAMMYVEFFPENGLLWLVELVSRASPEELKNFRGYSSGRRRILQTCQLLASFQDYFEQCEWILFRLAVYETENGIGDNSQGYWGDLFSILLSGTQTPFPDRLEILIRRMKSFEPGWDAHALEVALGSVFSWSSTRVLPPKIVGGKLIPEDWSHDAVKTFGDILNIHENILRRLREEKDAFPANVREILFGELLKQMRFYLPAVVMNDNIPNLYRDALLAYMDTGDKEEKRLRILAEIDASLDHLEYLKKERNTPSEEQKEYLRNWRSKLTNNKLSERLRLLLQGNVFQYINVDKIKEELPQTAKEILASGHAESLMRKTLQASGLRDYTIYSLALLLGEQDHDMALFPLARERFMDGDGNFADGYFQGASRISMPERVRAALDEALDKNPAGALRVTLSSDMSQEGFERILKAMDRGGASNPNLLLGLISEEWSAVLIPSQKWELLSRLVRSGTKDGLYVFCHISRQWFLRTREDKAREAQWLLQTLFEMTPQSRCLTDVNFEYIQLLTELLPFDQERCLKLATDDVEFANSSAKESLSFLECHIAECENQETVFYVCDRLFGHSDAFPFISPLRTLVHNLPLKFALAWVAQDAPTRAVIIAYHLPSPSMEKVDVPEITRAILREYGDNSEVTKRFRIGVAAWRVFSMSELEDIVAQEEPILREYANDENPVIRQWAEDEQQTLHAMLERQKRMDAQHAAQSVDRFHERA